MIAKKVISYNFLYIMFSVQIEAILISFKISQGLLKSVDYNTCNRARSAKKCCFEKIAFSPKIKN